MHITEYYASDHMLKRDPACKPCIRHYVLRFGRLVIGIFMEWAHVGQGRFASKPTGVLADHSSNEFAI